MRRFVIGADSATEWAWFSIFFEKAFVSLVKGRLCIRMVRF